VNLSDHPNGSSFALSDSGSTQYPPPPISRAVGKAIAAPAPLLSQAELSQLLDVAALITETFYANDHWLGWLSPLIRLGIHQDLRQRLLNQLDNTAYPHYACLIATRPAPLPTLNLCPAKPTLLGTVEISLRSIPELGLSDFACPYLSNLAIGNPHRRQGIALQLLKRSEETIRNWGFREIYLHVLENNRAALDLYRKLGYHIRRSDNHWGNLLFGQPRQLLMHKALTSRAN
jgi:GNAT superfamily N-acetyltransferase